MCEFTTLESGLVDEADANGDGVDDAMGAAPAAPAPMPAAPAAPAAPMPADPNAMGAAPAAPAAPADPNTMTAAPAAAAAPAPAPAAPEAQGFTPQDGAPAPEEGDDEMELPDEAVTDDEFQDSAAEASQKIDAMNQNFEELLNAVKDIKSQLDNNSDEIGHLRGELEKRNPTPVEKLNMRAKDGYPFNSGVDDYWDRKTPENYETEPETFEIRKSDIDNINDWANISKEMRGQSMGIKDILGY